MADPQRISGDQFVLALALAADAWLLYGLLDRLDLKRPRGSGSVCRLSLGGRPVRALAGAACSTALPPPSCSPLPSPASACTCWPCPCDGRCALCWLQAERDPVRHQLYESPPWGLASPCWCWDGCTTPWEGRHQVLTSLAAPACPSGSIPLFRPAACGHGPALAAAALVCPGAVISAPIPGMGRAPWRGARLLCRQPGPDDPGWFLLLGLAPYYYDPADPDDQVLLLLAGALLLIPVSGSSTSPQEPLMRRLCLFADFLPCYRHQLPSATSSTPTPPREEHTRRAGTGRSAPRP